MRRILLPSNAIEVGTRVCYESQAANDGNNDPTNDQQSFNEVLMSRIDTLLFQVLL